MKLTDFKGNWRIERQIDDRRMARVGSLSGTAKFESRADGMIYTETGILRFPGQPDLSANQTYLWSMHGSDICVRFADGRDFHIINVNTKSPSAHHDCPPDDYLVHYDFSNWPEWCSTWIVRGPSKDYIMETRYTAPL